MNAPREASPILLENLTLLSSGSKKKRFRDLELENDMPKFNGLAMMTQANFELGSQ